MEGDVPDLDTVVPRSSHEPPAETADVYSSATGAAGGSGGDATLLDDMIAAATAAKAARDAARRAADAEAEKSFGAGLDAASMFKGRRSDTAPAQHCAVCGAAGGSLQRCARCRSVWYCSRECQSADWAAGHKSICRSPKSGSDDVVRGSVPRGVVLPEVQDAMSRSDALSDKLKDGAWMTPEFLEQMKANPKIVHGLSNPRMMAAISEFSTAPREAAAKYKDDVAVNDFMREFMGLVGDHLATVEEATPAQAATATPATAAAAASDLARERGDDEVARVLSDPEVAEWLQDPAFRTLLSECRDPRALRRHLDSPGTAQKLRKLQSLGMVRLE